MEEERPGWLDMLRRAYRRVAEALDLALGGTPKLPDRIRLNVLPDRGSYARGDTVSGTVMVRGSSVTETLYELMLTATPFTPNPLNSADEWASIPSNHLISVLLEEELVIAAAEVLSIPFFFQIPHDALISENEEGIGQPGAGCRVTATGTNRGGLMSATTVVQIQMHRGIKALLAAMSKCGFEAVGTLRWDSGGSITRQYRSRPQLAEWIQAATLTAGKDGETVRGKLTLVRAPGNLAERVRQALSTSESIQMRLEIPYNVLESPKGVANASAGVPYIQKAIADSMFVSDGARSRLLRASEVPDSDTLLHPAHSAAHDPDVLLHSFPSDE